MRSAISSAGVVIQKKLVLDSSDYDSDAGASPSFSDTDSSSVSSRASSPGALRMAEVNFTTPKKRPASSVNDNNSTNVANVRPSRRKTVTVSTSSRSKQSGSTGVTEAAVSSSANKSAASISKSIANNGSEASITPATPSSARKRKRQSDKSVNVKTSEDKRRKLLLHSSSKKVCLNQRRRTKSERNTRAGKSIPVPVEESVALDAEIDKVLEEKAIKNNLTATNVKSIIRHVITNNMVQKMIMSTGKKKTGGNPDDSSGDEALYEPKLTRARTKQILDFYPLTNRPLWPSLAVSSPVKSKNKPVSETHVLINEELPEDSSGDEEYVPKEDEEVHSDDESSSVASHTSEKGSPSSLSSTSSKRTPVSLARTRQGHKDEETSKAMSKEGTASPVFKTPTPVRPKCVRKLDSGISKRTRSKLPLNDTPLEDLEMQLIPPDITTDMYDWNISDNEDYLAFLKDFLCPGQNTAEGNEAGDDDEVADPEYNVMEEEEEHDKEELRMDRAVKVSKKELSELVAELIDESHFNSEGEFDDTDLASFCASKLSYVPGNNIPEVNIALQPSCTNSSNPNSSEQIARSLPLPSPQEVIPSSNVIVNKSLPSNNSIPNHIPVIKREEKGTQNPERDADDGTAVTQTEIIATRNKTLAGAYTSESRLKDGPLSPLILPPGKLTIINNGIIQHSSPDMSPIQGIYLANQHLHASPPTSSIETLVPEPDLFNSDMISILKHQIRQHTQLLAQSYVLTVTCEDPDLKSISFQSKGMINEMRKFLQLNGSFSVFSGGNLEYAWNLVNTWPVKSSKSPIKKKILEEKYINDCQKSINGCSRGRDPRSVYSSFPRAIVKVIAESPAFPYPKLLPQCYHQKSSTLLRFTLSEDMLLVYAYDDMKQYEKMSTREKASYIAKTLLPARTTESVYHRIKNMRRNSNTSGDPAIRDYFQHGIPLPGAAVPEYFNNWCLRSPMGNYTELSPIWKTRIDHLSDTTESNWGKNRKKPRNQVRKRTNYINDSVDSEKFSSSPTSSPASTPDKRRTARNSEVLRSVFPIGSEITQGYLKPCKDNGSFPIKDGDGNLEVWISFPTWLSDKEKSEQTVTTNSSGSTDTGLARASYEISSPKLSKDQRESPELVETICTESVVSEMDSVSIIKVGDPIDLPCGVVQDNDVIDLTSLSTPLKRAILKSAEGPGPLEHHVSDIDRELPDEGLRPVFNKSIKNFENHREMHSARTLGGTREDVKRDYMLYDDGVGDPSDSSKSDHSSSDNDLSSTEEDIDRGSPLQVVEEIVISSDEEAVTSSDCKRPPDPKDSGGDENTKSQSSSTSRQGASTASKSGASSVSVSQNISNNNLPMGGRRGRREDDEEDKNRKNNRRNPRDQPDKGIPETAEQEETEDDDNEAKDPAATSTQLKKQKYSNKRKDSKRKNPSKEKPKKSPNNSSISSGVSKKRPMKSSKCAPVEKMLEDDLALDEDVRDSFLEAFLLRLQAATEKKHPGLNNEFVRLLCDAAENTSENADKELLMKVKVLLKDYPEFAVEFSTFVESDDNNMPVKEDEYFQEKQQNEATIQFYRHLEKFTERNPQLKAKILHKIKIFSESGLSDRELAESLEPYFQGNEVMMQAFKATLPKVYLPDSISNPADFEVLDDENLDSQDDLNVESVTLPEEKAIPASNTCPCQCHNLVTATHVYSTRAKHCHKCCLKFQDGKVFVHNGRVTKQVNVEMTSASEAKKKSSGDSCKSCVPDSNTIGLKFKESLNAVPTSSSKLKEETEFKKPKAHASHHHQTIQVATALPCTVTSHVGLESLGDSKVHSSSSKTDQKSFDDPTFRTERKPWSLEEDHLILTAVKSVSEEDLDEAFERLTSELPNRDRTEVEGRCVELISLLQSEFGSSTGD